MSLLTLIKPNREDEIFLKNSKLYCCYSVPLRDYLIQNGLRYEICAKNPNSDILMWVFVRTEQLNKLLEEWSQSSK